jgi:hypothetical protein
LLAEVEKIEKERDGKIAAWRKSNPEPETDYESWEISEETFLNGLDSEYASKLEKDSKGKLVGRALLDEYEGEFDYLVAELEE